MARYLGASLAVVGAAGALVLIIRRRRCDSDLLSPRRRAFRELGDCMALRSVFRQRMGLDIGGTLAKHAFAFAPGHNPLASTELTTAHYHSELQFQIRESGESGLSFDVHFLTIPTHLLQVTAKSIRQRMRYEGRQPSMRRIVAAGGGAHRFKDAARTLLEVELRPFKELEAVVRGLQFLASHGPADELFTISQQGQAARVPWPETLYPFLLINLGSGVSVLRVSGPTEFTRIGGTACGGATFLGLARALTGVSDFDELMRMADRGDDSRVDKVRAERGWRLGEVGRQRGRAELS